jgi:hypothetical protein
LAAAGLCLSAVLIAWWLVSGPGLPEGELGLGVLVREWLRGERLEADRDEALNQQAAHREILRAAVAGDLPLPEAVAALRSCLEARRLAPHVLAHYPGRTDEERFGRALLDHVRRYLGPGSRAEAVAGCLEADLDVYLARLPAPPHALDPG